MAQLSISRSVAIELLRIGMAHNHLLSPDEKYLALCGANPQNSFTLTLTQKQFNQYVKQLRYSGNDQGSMKIARDALEEVVRGIFEKIPHLRGEASDANWLHLRLIVTPKELGLLPFEFALTPEGFAGERDKPFLLNPQRLTTLTREIRQATPRAFTWPTVPRVLFAWAEPGKTVPHDQHSSSLMQAIWPWVRPLRGNAEPVRDVKPRFTELARATLNDIRVEFRKAAASDPYTHVHILAHGTDVGDEEDRQFGLALHKEGSPNETDAVDEKRLASALVMVDGGVARRPTVVVISACDGGSEGSPITPGASLAHSLHTSGIPYVLASQFPLTDAGSVTLVDDFYPRLFRGDDPRCTLYDLRQALMDKHSDTHDWASLVAYARFPEDLDNQLKDVQLAVVLDAMKTANAWADHVLKHGVKIEGTFVDVEQRLDNAIHDLERLLGGGLPDADNPKRTAEHLGLLGSAYKRKAEHLYRLAGIQTSGAVGDTQKRSRQALEAARKWYGKGYASLPSHHWTGCQYLSLTAVSHGTLFDVVESDDVRLWTVIQYMAERDLKVPEQHGWALGSLAELYLLQPFTVPPDQSEAAQPKAMEKARECLRKLNETGKPFEKESTARQFERYMTWWPDAFQTHSTKRLQTIAAELRQLLPPLEEWVS